MTAKPAPGGRDPAGSGDGPDTGRDRPRLRLVQQESRLCMPAGVAPAQDACRAALSIHRALLRQRALVDSVPGTTRAEPGVNVAPQQSRLFHLVLVLLAVTAVVMGLHPVGEVERPGEVVPVEVRVDGRRVSLPGGGVRAISLQTYRPAWLVWQLRDRHREGYERVGGDTELGGGSDRQFDTERGPSDVDLYESAPDTALVAAANAAARPVAVRGSGVEIVYGADTDGVFPARGQVVIRAGAKKVGSVTDLVAAAHDLGGKTTVALRGGGTGKVQLIPEQPPRLPFVAITQHLSARVTPGVRTSVPDGQGGSAGLAMALDAYSWLAHVDLVHGNVVAATGGITEDGSVYPVNGISQKALAARRDGVDVLLVPAANLMVARRSAGTMRVVGVTTLGDAITALHGWTPASQGRGH